MLSGETFQLYTSFFRRRSSSSQVSTQCHPSSTMQVKRRPDLSCTLKDASEMAAYISKEQIDIVDACFVDPLGTWHHCSFTPSQVEKKDIENGFAFDGSSIRLFCTIDQSDMIMVPDPTTCWIDPFQTSAKVLHVTCSITDPQGRPFNRCPRNTAKRAVQYLRKEGIADKVFMGPEAEFFVFDDVRYTCSTNSVGFHVNHSEGYWNTNTPGSQLTQSDKRLEISVPPAAQGNLGHRAGAKRYYFPVSPIDTMTDVRNDMLLTMAEIGMPAEKHHHEVACCQHELGYTCRQLVECGDWLMAYKYIVKNVAKKHNKTATFMPKPLYGDNGSGMHVHQSLWKGDVNLFWDEKASYMQLSEMAMHYIGGLLHHAHAVLAFTNPTTNSYKRLVPGFEAPVNLVYSKGNRSAAIRIPLADAHNPKAKRMEFRCPDAACNPYLAYAAMLMAGLDGIKKKIVPPAPMDCDIYELSKDKRKLVRSTPSSLTEVIDALENDHGFLTEGGVFPEDFIHSYIAYKREEVILCTTVPHPKEYELYYNC